MRHMPANSIDIRKVNRNRIYRFIYNHPGTSRPELVQRLEMSLPTVMQNVKSLFGEGLVRENGSLESTGGRKAVALSCVKEARLSIGVEITRNHVGVVIINIDGEVVKSVRHRVPFTPDEAFAGTLGGMVRDLLASAKVDTGRVLGAGVSLPGFLSADGGLFRTTVLPGALHYETRLLGDAIGFPAIYANDANAAAIAEMWGAPQGKSFVYLSLSNTVGGAIVMNSHLELGDNQRAGEFGHIAVEYGGTPCYCGQRGCLDAYCAASLLSERADGNLEKFFARLEDGDSAATKAWNTYMDYLARAVNVLRMTFDCEVVVGGYVGALMEKHVGELRRRVAQLDSHEKSGSYVNVCRRRTEASAVGAALMHIVRFINEV